jgi:hypothetical protein
MGQGRSFRSLALGSLLAAAVTLASVAAWAGHTDDGCVVELHCFACYWAHAATVEVALAVDPAPVLEPIGDQAPVLSQSVVAADRPVPASRGPPQP